MRKILALVLALLMVLPLTGVAFAEEATTTEPRDENTPLVVAYSPFSAKFSPFYADTAYDQDVVGMTQLGLMTTDRMGGVIYNGIEGETVPYNGTDYRYTGIADLKVEYDEATDTTKYTAKLRDDLKFSDGEPLTADDVIFTYYTYLDPSYAGSTTLSSYGILGVDAYRTQVPEEGLEKIQPVFDAILAAGLGYEVKADDAFTQEEYDAYWGPAKEMWLADTQGITDTVYASYGEAYAGTIGTDYETLTANEGLKVALGMALWGFGSYADGVLTTAAGDTFDIANGVYPTNDDYLKAAAAKYGNSFEDYLAAGESATGTSTDDLKTALYNKLAADNQIDTSAGVPNVRGIVKVDDYTVEVTTKGYEAPAVYSILGIQVAPLHYYGDKAKYDYENNKFGFDFGDLSVQKSKLGEPMGAGPYKFVKYENKVVYFEANENYFKGCPKIKYIQFKETASAEVATAVKTGDVDAGEMTGSKGRFEEVRSYNSNGELSGDVITTSRVDNLGYGYIGMNADTVNVGGNPSSAESKALRKAIATVLAVYRDVAFDSYYGDAASVIQYPISNTSWAAPQATDPDYKQAFSTDPEGNQIYTADMEPEAKYDAALAASLKWFEAAGYTVTDGKLTAAPEGAKLSYEVIIPGDGTGDHPSYLVLTNAKAAFEKIGLELVINDPADSNVLWDALDAGTQELWCAAWGATIDPDMYQVYHSSGIVGRGGSDSNHYHIDDPELDKLIVDARKSDDQAYRKAVYKQALDTIVDWAVEIPAYQRQNCIIFSTERINLDTLTPDITTFWGWMNDIEGLELKY